MNFCRMYEGFGRDFGYPARVRIKTVEELSQLIDEKEGVNPCFLSCSYYQIDTPYLVFIPFDFDGNEDRVLRDVNRMTKDFEDRDIPYVIKLSGNKGLHTVIELEFDPEKPKFVSPETMRNIQMTCMKRNELETLDYHLIGNVNALLRISCTVHEKSKALCLPLREKKGTISIEDLCERLEVKEHKYTFSNNFVGKESIHPYPCLEYFIRVPNPLNYCRVAFAIYRLKQGMEPEEIFEELSKFGWKDWNERKTTYHLGKIAKRGYSMPSCKKLKSFGLCLGDSCKYNDARLFKFIRILER